MIYTSYYACRIPDVKKIAISLYPPKWFDGPRIKELAPSPETFAIKGNPEAYKQSYIKQLDSLSDYYFRDILYVNEPTAYCCFESLKKPDEWCHRRILAEYIEERFDMEVPELTKENKPEIICPAVEVVKGRGNKHSNLIIDVDDITPDHVHKVCRLTYLGYPDNVQAEYLGITPTAVREIKAGHVGEDISENYDLSTPPNERLTFIPEFVNPDIDLDEPTHTYSLLSDPDQKFISCTTLLKGYFEDFDGHAIATNLIENHPRYKGRTVEDLLDEWSQVGKDGTAIHKELEDYILTNGAKDVRTVKAGHGKNWIKHILKDPKFVIYPEVILFIKELGIAGTIDLLIINTETNVVYIADWKTNKKISMRGYGGKKGIHPISEHLDDSKFSHYSLQLSLYRWILERNYKMKVDRLAIVHLTPKNCHLIMARYLGDEITAIMEDRKQQLENKSNEN
jgi:hypothetical protein